jgi:hypothetical protein
MKLPWIHNSKHKRRFVIPVITTTVTAAISLGIYRAYPKVFSSDITVGADSSVFSLSSDPKMLENAYRQCLQQFTLAQSFSSAMVNHLQQDQSPSAAKALVELRRYFGDTPEPMELIDSIALYVTSELPKFATHERTPIFTGNKLALVPTPLPPNAWRIHVTYRTRGVGEPLINAIVAGLRVFVKGCNEFRSAAIAGSVSSMIESTDAISEAIGSSIRKSVQDVPELKGKIRTSIASMGEQLKQEGTATRRLASGSYNSNLEIDTDSIDPATALLLVEAEKAASAYSQRETLGSRSGRSPQLQAAAQQIDVLSREMHIKVLTAAVSTQVNLNTVSALVADSRNRELFSARLTMPYLDKNVLSAEKRRGAFDQHKDWSLAVTGLGATLGFLLHFLFLLAHDTLMVRRND